MNVICDLMFENVFCSNLTPPAPTFEHVQTPTPQHVQTFRIRDNTCIMYSTTDLDKGMYLYNLFTLPTNFPSIYQQVMFSPTESLFY